jgi:hypothetical protein
MQYDFQSAGGVGVVNGNLTSYRTNYPSEDAYWSNFTFSDGTTANTTCVYKLATYTNGPLPTFYSVNGNRMMTANAPIYRIMANAKWNGGGSTITGAAQEDVMLALVPLTTFAIFYNGLLEFSTCATMTVNGPVHSNTNIFVGAGSGASLTFNSLVSASGTISAPTNNGSNWGNPTNFNSTWRTTFAGSPTNYVTNIASIPTSIPMTNTHSIIEMPTAPSDWTNAAGSTRLYNQAQIILLVSNTSVTTIIQQAPIGSLPASDPTPYTNVYSTNISVLASNLPFLSLGNTFRDGREGTTNITTQIDVGRYGQWTSTNAQIIGNGSIVGKYPSGSGTYPTILYVADNRTAGANQLTVVRLTNGVAPPSNGGQGFSVATPNPLYVWGNYNQTNSGYLYTSNTSAGTVPCAFLSDALTILSSNWSDSVSFGNYSSSSWNASAQTTVNAAIITGIVPSTSTDNMHFSGGVHNLPRLLEDWSSSTLWLNTSIVNLFNSQTATGQFINPGTYYNPPTRKFSYDLNFSNANNVPPGIPCALVALRYNWAVPPPGVTNYSVIP